MFSWLILVPYTAEVRFTPPSLGVFQSVPGPASYGDKYAMKTTVMTKTPRMHGLYFSAEFRA